ncbi:MAG TPA: DedA family protein [Candidatus Saccharimonadales bacterium]|nr:DedA family protein [Candidatus Saccharimonadales bacterium]
MLEPESLLGGISVIGALAIIAALVFAESAFLVGLFVPGGDTLLIVTGILAAQGSLPLVGVMIVIFLAAAIGDNVGYYIGEKTGPKVFKQKGGIFFRKEYAEWAAAFYQKHGSKTVVIARFIAYVRTFVPLLAGIAKMPRLKFTFYNIFGALFWTLSLVLLGYWLGKEFADFIERYILPFTILGLLLLFSPTIIYLVRILLAKFKR